MFHQYKTFSIGTKTHKCEHVKILGMAFIIFFLCGVTGVPNNYHGFRGGSDPCKMEFQYPAYAKVYILHRTIGLVSFYI